LHQRDQRVARAIAHADLQIAHEALGAHAFEHVFALRGLAPERPHALADDFSAFDLQHAQPGLVDLEHAPGLGFAHGDRQRRDAHDVRVVVAAAAQRGEARDRMRRVATPLIGPTRHRAERTRAIGRGEERSAAAKWLESEKKRNV
jgi:hypothetical protein